MKRDACYGLIDHANKKPNRAPKNPNSMRSRERREQAWRGFTDKESVEIDDEDLSRRPHDHEL